MLSEGLSLNDAMTHEKHAFENSTFEVSLQCTFAQYQSKLEL